MDWNKKFKEEFRGIWGMRRECCVILASHILCWGNEKQMGNMLPNMAQAWLSGKQERVLFRFEEPTEPSFPIFGLWRTSFCDLHPRLRAGSLAHIFPLLHKGGNWNKTECLPSTNLGYHMGQSTLSSHLAWSLSRSPVRDQWRTQKLVDDVAGKLSGE